MPDPRDALIVLLRILQEIPEDQTEFRKELEHLGRNSLTYRSPEARLRPSTWLAVDVIMKKYIPDADPNNEDWKKNCVDIFVGTK
jgi:hypothetical protein